MALDPEMIAGMARDKSPRRCRVEVNWRPLEVETDHDTSFLDRVTDVTEDLAELEAAARDSHTVITSGSHGKGAAATAVLTAWEVSEHLLNDAASLVGLGIARRAFITKMQQKRGHAPALVNKEGLAALAAAAASQQLIGAYYIGTVPLNVSEGVGTDERDVWAVCFEHPNIGSLYLIFMSPSGRVLGTVPLPVEMYYDGHEWLQRNDQDIPRGGHNAAAPSCRPRVLRCA